MSYKEFGDKPSPKKEDAVREALGVEKKFRVFLNIPTTGIVHLNSIAVMALNESDAIKKAVELSQEDGIDADGCEQEEAEHSYDYDSVTNNWRATAQEAN